MKLFNFDPEKNIVVESKSTFFKVLRKVIWLFLASIAMSLVYYVLFALIFNTKEEKKLIREKVAIQREFSDLEKKLVVLENSVSDMESRDREIYRDLFNSDPPTFVYSEEKYNQVHEDSSSYFDDKLVEKVSSDIKEAEEATLVNESVISKVFKLLQSKIIDSIPSLIPVDNFSIRQTGASLGDKIHPFYKTITFHTGIDLVTPLGTDVYASAAGRVIDIQKSEKGFGNRIIIDHGNGYVTTYSHLSIMSVRAGKRVSKGDRIGRVGNTGKAFAPHLHYEVLLNGEYQEPINYFFEDLDAKSYIEMMKIAMNTGQSLD